MSRAKKKGAPDGKMTIGELARRTGMTVRNIRAHQTRGLLPPPEVHGRTGYYNEEHVARIELTREMQAEGLNLEAIRRVLESTGGSSQEIVDFARAVRAPFEDETPEIFEPAELAAAWRVKKLDPKLIRHGEKLGILRELPDGKIEAISPRLHRAGLALIEFGVGPEAGMATGRQAAPPRRRRSPRLRRPFRQGDLGAVRPRRPPRGRVAEGAARRWSGCGRWPPTRWSRCSRSRWARRPRKPPNGRCERSRPQARPETGDANGATEAKRSRTAS